MIESVLHLFKIHGKMIFGNTSIVVQNMFGKTPKPLDTVNMILGLLVDQCFRVIHGVMFTQAFQGVVASEGIGIVDGTFSGFPSNDRHQFFFGDMLHNPRVDLSIALQKAKNNVFTLSTTGPRLPLRLQPK